MECTTIIVNAEATEATCVLPNLPSGVHEIIFKATAGHVVRSKMYITSTLNVNTVNPTTAGTNGGSRLTISGYGFDEDTVVSMHLTDGEIICEFCYKESISATEIVFFSPRVASVGGATITVSHEFLPTDLSELDVMIERTLAEITARVDTFFCYKNRFKTQEFCFCMLNFDVSRKFFCF